MNDGNVRLPKFVPLWLVAALFFLFTGCGTGSSAGGAAQNQSGTPDFALAVSPSASSIVDGESTSVTLSAIAVNGFNAQITIQITGLPTGVSGLGSVTVAPGLPQQTVFSAPVGAPAVIGAAVTFTGTSGSLSHSAQLRLSVFGRLLSSALPHSVCPHRCCNRIFPMAEDTLDCIQPQYLALFHDRSPREPNLCRGCTDANQGPWVKDRENPHTAIDSVTMTVKNRYLASQIGSYGGYRAVATLVLADGRLALLGALGGIPSVDGSSSFAIWDPSNNSLAIYASTYGAGQAQG